MNDFVLWLQTVCVRVCVCPSLSDHPSLCGFGRLSASVFPPVSVALCWQVSTFEVCTEPSDHHLHPLLNILHTLRASVRAMTANKLRMEVFYVVKKNWT